ncbi:hypothetical protein RJ639_019062 [Escallonia herrerae]|uniref:Morc S5 domain-containing protein n=1 Tax=Escallonia herrerae TaxID=1293975 RepID=A0AA88V9F0_9ASTE|nr:hypothetical protein RJ639_019062 [Escallonia herrerae]
MSSRDIVDLSSDDDPGEVEVKAVKLERDFIKLEPGLIGISIQQKECHTTDRGRCNKSNSYGGRKESEDNRSSSLSRTSVLDQEQSPIDDASLPSTSSIGSAPLCRQFWKAGNYENGLTPKSTLKTIAELLDNAVDECSLLVSIHISSKQIRENASYESQIQNGATFVIVDKMPTPRNGSQALLIQDDGGGMDPEAMRRCLSFGFSDKKSKSAIGQYGNGFKTSSMRLGADVILFSRHKKRILSRILTQSVGLLSYTFLTQTGHNRIVVPMVNYELNTSTGTWDTPHWYSKESLASNLSILLQWSPFSTEEELLKQFDDIGSHGTKVIIYNLWLNDVGTTELDFETDPEDIRIAGGAGSTEKVGSRMAVSGQHIGNRLRYSLRAYLSVLYLQLPESFCILLRGRVLEYHNIANDLKFPEFILYRPQSGGSTEVVCCNISGMLMSDGSVVTTIGFLKEAPNVNIHGFNVYHKNRLILPFWPVVSYSDSRGRGVVGVLEANFVEPTHNKQDFEKTSVFQKLEGRLKEMTLEYWDYHCGLIGYQVKRKVKVSQGSSDCGPHHGSHQPVVLSRSFSAAASFKSGNSTPKSLQSDHERKYLKRKEYDYLEEPEKVKRKASIEPNTNDTGVDLAVQPGNATGNQSNDQEALNLIQENKKLLEQCLEYEKREVELKRKVMQLRTEVGEAQGEYARLLAESQQLENVKQEKKV